VTAYRRIPFTGLDILPVRPFLKINLAFAVKHMEVDHWMQQPASAMRLAPCHFTDDAAVFINLGNKTIL
jgi:hypothetical protein